MSDASLRQRKKKHHKKSPPQIQVHANPTGDAPSLQKYQDDDLDAEDKTALQSFFRSINVLIGVAVMIAVGYKYSQYCMQLLENQLWFSNIKEVEREISFRTESGLYYSYYKQMVNAETIEKGLYELTHDNLTEHMSTVNVLARMNVYQEVGLAIMYRNIIKPWYPHIEAVYFYLHTIFGLHGLLLAALYLFSWQLSGSWLAGLLTAALYVANKEDTTRVAYVVPLRESFSLPFLWVQIMLISVFFSNCSCTIKKVACVVGIVISTFLFALFWQFNQFVLLLQAMALFGCQVLQVVPHKKILLVYCAQLLSLLAVSGLQYFNTMILTGPLFSFVPAAILLMCYQTDHSSKGGVLMKAGKVILYIIAVFVLAAVFSLGLKLIWPQDADEHIFRFALVKFGLAKATRDFDVQLYLCNGAFQFLPHDVFLRLSKLLAFPLYAVCHMALLLVLLKGVVHKWGKGNKKDKEGKHKENEETISGRPHLAYLTIQPVLFGVMAVAVLRMKYLWTPYMCVMAAAGIADYHVWAWITKQLGSKSHALVVLLQSLVVIGLLGLLAFLHLPAYYAELENLREFYDPDTVELMEWIKSNTAPTAAFAGSMQLLAGVKLCTGRPITNHPHYEDKALRARTRELYQMYGQFEASQVHLTLARYGASYIILEDSICLSRRGDRCRTGDIVDSSYGMLPDGVDEEEGLVAANVPRFCDQIRYGGPPFIKYFRLVFQNKTFRVYQVLKLQNA